jgi:3-methyladenine DNA glycosylase AlkC
MGSLRANFNELIDSTAETNNSLTQIPRNYNQFKYARKKHVLNKYNHLYKTKDDYFDSLINMSNGNFSYLCFIVKGAISTPVKSLHYAFLNSKWCNCNRNKINALFYLVS